MTGGNYSIRGRLAAADSLENGKINAFPVHFLKVAKDLICCIPERDLRAVLFGPRKRRSADFVAGSFSDE
jgi:hypothetical protein